MAKAEIANPNLPGSGWRGSDGNVYRTQEEANRTFEPGFTGDTSDSRGKSSFDPAYRAAHPDQFRENPYIVGTRAYKDFEDEQVRSVTERAGMPQAPVFRGSSAEAYGGADVLDEQGRIISQGYKGPKLTAGTLESGGKLTTPRNVEFNANPGNLLDIVTGGGTPSEWLSRLTGASAENATQQTPSLLRMLPYAAGTTGAILGSRDTKGYEKLSDRATSAGASPWLNLQLQRQRGEEAQRLDEVNRQGRGAIAEGESNLAMRGGLQSGAGERLQSTGLEAALRNMQGVRAGGQNERLGLQIADEATKTQLLSQLPGEERAQTEQLLGGTKYLTGLGQQENALAADIGFRNLANATEAERFNIGNVQDVSRYNIENKQNTEKYNIGNYLNELLQGRAQDNYQYGQQAAGYAAEKTGQGIAQSGKK